MAATTALITGVTGQDGRYLTEYLLARGYRVHGLVRRAEAAEVQRQGLGLAPEGPAPVLHVGDLGDAAGLARLVDRVAPDELYHLAAQSHVPTSFRAPAQTADVIANGTARLLEAVRLAGLVGHTRVYNAASSEMFGRAGETPQSEATPFRPCSPYGTAKLHAFWLTVTYREAFGLHASNGLLFNHESPRRGAHFVTRRITRAVAAIARGRTDPLTLGNLDARRDWGHARDYVAGMHAMLQQDRPDDYVLATGEARSVRGFAEAAFACIGRRLVWRGRGVEEIGQDADTGATLVTVDPARLRPTDIDALVGDAAKARRLLGWRPQTAFADLVAEMVEADLRILADGNAAP